MNCKFKSNNAKRHGCDISNTPESEIKIIDCEFSPKSDAIWNRNLIQVWESQIDEIEKFIDGGYVINTYGIKDAEEYNEEKIGKIDLSNKRFDVFLSFKSDDNEITHEVYEYLEDNSVKCWMSEKDIGGGVSFGKEIVNALNNTKSVLLIYSKDTPKSEWVNRELYYATKHRVHIFPFIVDDSKIIADEIDFIISSHNWIFLNEENKENSFKKIYNALESIKNKKN